jgi:hypothetical protein
VAPGWEARQIDVQEQALLCKGVAEGLPLAHVDPLEGGPQLRHCQRGEGIQHAGDRRLVGKLFSPPRRRERRLRPQTGVDLLEGRAVREYTDHHVEQFLVGLMKDGLAAELDVLPQRGEEIRLVQDVSQGR